MAAQLSDDEEFRLMLNELSHFKNNRGEYAETLKIPTLINYTPTCINMFSNERQRIQFFEFNPTFRGRYYTTKRVVIPLDGYLYADYDSLAIQMYALVSRLFFVLIHTDSDILLVTVPVKPHMHGTGKLMFILSGRLVIQISFDNYAVTESIVDNREGTDSETDSGLSSESDRD